MSTKKSAARKKSCEDVPAATEKTEAEKRFIRDLLIRGEAVEPLPDGELPAGATHKIVENKDEKEDLPQVERERFSIY